MGERRKIFRIEEMTAPPADTPADAASLPQLADIMQELRALRGLLAGTPGQAAAETAPKDLGRLVSELRFVRAAIGGIKAHEGAAIAPPSSTVPPARIAEELEAVTTCTEQATQKILAAAEDIDQAANTLSASLKADPEHGLAQDIRDRVIQIFEACNYQDLASQRVTKVMAMLGRMERQIARALDELARSEGPPLHGPRLPSDDGHVSQREVDAIFADKRKSA